MNVLFIVENNPIYRDQRVLSEINSIQKHFSAKIFVISPIFKKHTITLSHTENVKVYQYPCIEANNKLFQILEYFISAVFIFFISNYVIFRHKINIIHIANPPDFLILLLPFAIFYRAKIIYDQHDLSLEIFNHKKIKSVSLLDRILISLLKFFESLSYKYSHAVIFPNANVQEYYFSNVKKDLKINAVVMNGISVGHLNHLSTNEKIAASRSNSHPFKIIYIGIISKESGIDNLLYLASDLSKMNFKFNFEIFGEGTYLEEFRKSVNKTKMSNYFNFHGFLSISEIIPSAQYGHIGIVPLPDNSKNNIGTARKVFEYMMMALPVVSLKLKEVMNVVEDAGYFCTDFKQMSNVIWNISNEREELMRRGLLGQEKFINKFSWECQEENLFNIYKYLLQSTKQNLHFRKPFVIQE